MDSQSRHLSELTAEIVTAYAANNNLAPDEFTALIGDVYGALRRAPDAATPPSPEPWSPAVSARKSVTPDHLICLEDGKQFKSLKRHLQSVHGVTPAEYREKWGLKSDYPMVAPSYSEARSSLAKALGLGRKMPVAAPRRAPKQRSARRTKTPA